MTPGTTLAGGAHDSGLVALGRMPQTLADPPLAPATEAATLAMRSLFTAVFASPMSAEHWHWKYTLTQGGGVGLMREGRMVAHYGGVPRRVLHFGQPSMACQVCDVMVEASANKALVRRGPLYQVSAAYLHAMVGQGRAYGLAFGFPNQRAFAVAQRLGLYAQVDDVVRLAWPAAQATQARAGFATAALGQVQRLGLAGVGFSADEQHLINTLWPQMARAHTGSIIGVRDAHWLQHRYVMHPAIRYDIVLLRSPWWRRPLGVMVLRQHADHLQLLDLLAPPGAVPRLIQVARHMAQQAGLPELQAWITHSHVHHLAGPAPHEASLTELGIALPTYAHTAGPPLEALRGRWFLMAGDADFT